MRKIFYMCLIALTFMGCVSNRSRLKVLIVETYIEAYEDGMDCALNKPIEVCEKAIKALNKLKEDYETGRKR